MLIILCCILRLCHCCKGCALFPSILFQNHSCARHSGAPKRVSHVELVVKTPPVSAGDLRDMGSIPGSGWSLGGGNGNPFQYSCLESPMVRGDLTWWDTVHRVAKSQIWPKWLSTCTREFLGHWLVSCWKLVAGVYIVILNLLSNWWIVPWYLEVPSLLSDISTCVMMLEQCLCTMVRVWDAWVLSRCHCPADLSWTSYPCPVVTWQFLPKSSHLKLNISRAADPQAVNSL